MLCIFAALIYHECQLKYIIQNTFKKLIRMKKILLSVAMLCMALGGRAETQDVCQGWPADYGGVMLQAFWWDSYDATKWTNLTARAGELSQYFDLIWIPNAGTTSTGKWALDNGYSIPNSMGYDPCYWLEYNSCFGLEEELKTMIQTYKDLNVGIIEDVVVNHKNGVSGWCDFPNEEKVVDGKEYKITWDNETYAQICKNDECNWHGYQTNGDYDTGDNFDGYRDLDHKNPTTLTNVKVYVDYLRNVMGFAGFRYDMVKGYGAGYIKDYNEYAVNQPQSQNTQQFFSVGEYWDDQTPIQNWIMNTGNTSAAFDFPLKFKLNKAISGGDYSELNWKSFSFDPNFSQYAVTFADNHDTGRNQDKLQFNWSAANAFLLASPGTPCIWLKHYDADPGNIGAMIKAPKACGITNTYCNVVEQYTTDNNKGYVMKSVGSNGSVYVLFGQAVYSQTAPSNYTLVAEGDAYKFYAEYNEPAVTITPNGGIIYQETEVTITPNASALANTNSKPWYKVDEGEQMTLTGSTTITVNASSTIYWGAYNMNDEEFTGKAEFTKREATTETVYLNNAAGWSTVYCYAWNSGGELLGAWPGAVVTTEGTYRTYQQSFLGNYPAYVIWNAGEGGPQTEDLEYLAGTTYSNAVETSAIYLNNTAGFANVYCYAWNGNGELLGAWPGTKITDMNEDKYVASIPGTPTGIIWNDGNGTQTNDLVFEEGKTYTNGYVIYLNNVANWDPVYCYVWNDNYKDNDEYKYLGGWPGTVAKKNANGYYVILGEDNGVTHCIWNKGTGGDGNQTGDLIYSRGETYKNGQETTVNNLSIGGPFVGESWTTNNFVKDGDVWTYKLDLSANTGNFPFKFIANTNNWFGYSPVSFDAPSGWIEAATSDDNILLNNSSTEYKKYLMTATWRPNVSATVGWTVKIEGDELRNTWTIAGVESLVGANWDPAYAANHMTYNQQDNLYVLTKSDVALEKGTSYFYKVVKNDSWDNGSYGKDGKKDENQVLNVPETGLYTVSFYFNPSTKMLYATVEKETSFTIDGTRYPVGSTNNVALTDEEGSYFDSEVSFTATSATYSRAGYEDEHWGTLCLPFAIEDVSKYSNTMTFYNFSHVDGDCMYFDPIQSGGIDAGVPVVYKLSTSGGFAIDESNVLVANNIQPYVNGGWTMNGTYSKKSRIVSENGTDVYFVAEDKFWRAKVEIEVSAYRGWFETVNASSPAKLRIAVEGETEGIERVEQDKNSDEIVFDLSGRRSDISRTGLYIKHGKVVFIK